MRAALSVAGTDPTGGAGVQADLKTFAAHGVYGMGAITAVIAQNTLGVAAIEPVSPSLLRAQLDAVFDDVFPDAVKIGMIPNSGSIAALAGALAERGARNVVIDTVMVSSSGRRLLDAGDERALARALLPLADVVTPNIPEAETLCGMRIRSRRDMATAARVLATMTDAAILVKGGHLSDSADDLLVILGEETWFSAPRIESPHTHGTGCALSSAIASNLAIGFPPREAVGRAKEWLTRAILAAPGLGRGKGPVGLHVPI